MCRRQTAAWIETSIPKIQQYEQPKRPLWGRLLRGDRPALKMAGQNEVNGLEALLRTEEAAALLGVTVQHMRRMLRDGRYSCKVQTNSKNRMCYLTPLSALPEPAQKKYIADHSPAVKTAAPAVAQDKPAPKNKPLESYTAEERAEISCWMALVDQWQEYRGKAGKKKAECDEKFVLLRQLEEPERQISVETLYRKWSAIRAGDLDALVDKRGKARKGTTSLPPEVKQAFLTAYLDEAQKPIQRCVQETEVWVRKNMPQAMPLPSYATFYRVAKAVPYPAMVLMREGEKAYYDKCSPYIRREYESIDSNDFWVGDTHTLDVISMGPDGKSHRLYLNAWLDARSGIFVGWFVSDGASSQATLNALRLGIEKHGIPKRVYVDNGREYLTADVGGRGHRAKKKLADGS